MEKIALAVLAVGALLDGYVYYAHHTSSGLVYVMMAFLFCIIFYIIGGVIDFMVNYARQQQLLADQKTQLVQSRTAAMMGQIRSHFIFNDQSVALKNVQLLLRMMRYTKSNMDR